MSYAVGVVGATGQVGREFLRILEEGDRPGLPIRGLRLFASERSAGKRVTVRGQEHVIERAEPDPRLFEGLDFVLSAIGDEAAKQYGPAIARAGALNVDKSNAWRMAPGVPLVVPEVNPQDARAHKGIIAGPNCSTTQMVVALWPIHQVNPLQRIVVDTYQAVSGTGWRAVDELQAQISGEQQEARIYPHQIHLNLWRHVLELLHERRHQRQLGDIGRTDMKTALRGTGIEIGVVVECRLDQPFCFLQ